MHINLLLDHTQQGNNVSTITFDKAPPPLPSKIGTKNWVDENSLVEWQGAPLDNNIAVLDHLEI